MRSNRPPLDEIEAAVVALSADCFGVAQERISIDTRPVQDLGVDSLDLVEWIMAVEDRFQVSLPAADQVADQVYKEVFTRPGFSLRDVAELVHIRWGSPPYVRKKDQKNGVSIEPGLFFSQLGGTLSFRPNPLHRPIGPAAQGFKQYRRMTDGMTCVRLLGGTAEIGSDDPDAGADERPVHDVTLSPFLMDKELVSTTAYCRFLNSIGSVDDETLAAWFLIAHDERRFEHQVIERRDGLWIPKAGAAEWPMILVSWHGANAYSIWANGEDWSSWKDEGASFLPAEKQWEYAARGPKRQRWPWGDRDPVEGEINAGVHASPDRYDMAAELPLQAVNAPSGVSPFGPLQMAGNTWQWCRDWYDPKAYEKTVNAEAPARETGVRCERGGSWVGPQKLARSSYRRGRAPDARGRCLGFRCVGRVPQWN